MLLCLKFDDVFDGVLLALTKKKRRNAKHPNISLKENWGHLFSFFCPPSWAGSSRKRLWDPRITETKGGPSPGGEIHTNVCIYLMWPRQAFFKDNWLNAKGGGFLSFKSPENLQIAPQGEIKEHPFGTPGLFTHHWSSLCSLCLRYANPEIQGIKWN